MNDSFEEVVSRYRQVEKAYDYARLYYASNPLALRIARKFDPDYDTYYD